MRNYVPGQRDFVDQLKAEKVRPNRNRLIASFKTVSPIQSPIGRNNVLDDLFGNPSKSLYKEGPVVFYREDL